MMALNYIGLAIGLSIAACMASFARQLHKENRRLAARLRGSEFATDRWRTETLESWKPGWESELSREGPLSWKLSGACSKTIEEIEENQRNALINSNRIISD